MNQLFPLAQVKSKKKNIKEKGKHIINQEKLDKATVYYNHIKPLINDFDNSSANAIAKIAKDSGWLNSAATSKIKDDVRNANDYLVLESKAPSDKAAEVHWRGTVVLRLPGTP